MLPDTAYPTQRPESRRLLRLIVVLSVAIPGVVALLLRIPGRAVGWDVHILPALNAVINSTVTVLLLLGLYFIRRRNWRAHRASMLAAFALSAVFLISYVTYHALAEETRYGGTGFIRYVYFVILITHILMAIAIVPLVLLTLYRAYTGNWQRHRRLARITWPIWLYVSVTGVVVYFMISPYYA